MTDSPGQTLALARTAAGAVSGARLHLTGARASAAALARNLDCAQQQLAVVNGSPSAEETEEGES